MEKRFLLFITFALFIMFTWSAAMKKMQPVGTEDVTEAPVARQPAADAEPESPAAGPDDEQIVTVSVEGAEIVFNELSASIKEIVFKGHADYLFPFHNGLLLDDKGLFFSVEERAGESIVFVHEDGEKRVSKRFDFSNFPYAIELEIFIHNKTDEPKAYAYPLVLGALDLSRSGFDARYQDISLNIDGRVRQVNGKKAAEYPSVEFVAFRDRYFCALLDPEDSGARGFVRVTPKRYGSTGIYLSQDTIPSNSQIGHLYRVFCGPQDSKLLASYNAEWSSVINYGFFDPISQIIVQVLNLFYRVTHNWGTAIILMSMGIYFILFPLTVKQMRSMKSMQSLQPHIDEIRNSYKDNPQKMNKEIFELYRKHKVNPFSGCLPLIVQMPIFIALYPVLMRSADLRGAQFLWIQDLSSPDRLAVLPFSLPVLGNEINLLPLLMVGGMFIQQKISMKSASTQSAEQQKVMMFLFPLLFGFIFYKMPSGLVLYWLINSTIMLAFQLKMNKT